MVDTPVALTATPVVSAPAVVKNVGLPLWAERYALEVLADSPVAHWRLGDLSGNFADASGNGRTGTPNGTIARGVGGAGRLRDSAIQPDGATGYVTSSDAAFGPGSGAFSVEFWYKSGVPAGVQTIVSKGASAAGVGNKGYEIVIRPTSTRLQFSLSDGATLTSPTYTNAAVGDGAWHHVVCTRSGASMTVYFDGAAVAASAAGPTGDVTSADSFTVARRSSSGVQFYPGVVDEVAFYASALSPSRVLAHYNAAFGVLSASSVARGVGKTLLHGEYYRQVLKDTPRGYWRLGESAGTTAADSGSGGHPGTYTAGYTLGQAGALASDPDQAVLLNGSTGYVNLGSFNLNFPDPNKFTIEAWVKFAGALASANSSFWGHDGAAGQVSVEIGGGTNVGGGSKGRLYVNEGGAGSNVAQAGDGTFPDDQAWHHLVYTKDGTGANNAFYLDGVAVALTLNASITLTNAVAARVIGRRRPSGTTAYFPGYIDEVAVYDHALPASRVLAHYQAGVRAWNSASLTKGIATTLTATPGSTASLTKALAALLVTMAGSAATILKGVAFVLTANPACTATLVKGVGKVLAAEAGVATASLTRSVGKVLAATAGSVATFTYVNFAGALRFLARARSLVFYARER